MLTAKQKQLLDFLIAYLGEHKRAPSFEEMKAALGLSSKSGVHRLIAALEERKYIIRLQNRARAIEVIRAAGQPLPYQMQERPARRFNWGEMQAAIAQMRQLGYRVEVTRPLRAA